MQQNPKTCLEILTEATNSHWIKTHETGNKAIYTDICVSKSYFNKVKDVVSRIPNIEVIGLHENMVFVALTNPNI